MPYEYPFNTFPLVNKVRITNPAANLDARYGPWPSTLSALEAFDPVLRHKGLTVGVDTGSGVVEYWFKDGVADNNLIVKQVPLSASNISGGKPLTTTNDSNITLTLSGTSSSALLNAVVLSAGWTGQLPIDRGGTGASTRQAAINTLAGGPGTSGRFLRSDGTNVILSAIQVSDVPTLNQNTTGSAGTLATTRTLWGQNFNGSQNVSGTLSAVGDIIGSSAITLSAGTGNNNINLTPSGTGLVTVTGNLSASNSITARDITATNLLSAASTFTRVLSVQDVQVRTVSAFNIFIGNSTTGRDATTGSHNFVLGLSAGNALTTGSDNTFIGRCAGRGATNACGNNFLGVCAGINAATGGYNNFIGHKAGGSINTISGSANNFLGDCAGFCAGSGNQNNFIGPAAGYNASGVGSSNNYIGSNAGYNSTGDGSFNNFIGPAAGCTNTTGSFNNFLGYLAGCANTTGNDNIFIGDCAGRTNTTGSTNNFIGNGAGCANTTGNFNNFIGNNAGGNNTVGSNNTIIGNNANVSTNSLTGVIVLGTGAIATESNQVVLSTANVLFRSTGSTFEIGSPSLTDNLTVYGDVSSTGIVNTNTGFRISNGATTGHVLRGNGTNFVSSTLAAADIGSGQALTTTNDSNVTLSLSGSSSSALLKNVLLSAGWVGQLAVGRGGTGSNNGSIAGTSALTFAASGTNNITLSTVTGNVVIDRADINGGTIDGVSIGNSSVATYLKVDNVAVDSNNITFDSAGNINHTAGQYVAINGNSAGIEARLTGPVGADLVIGTNLNDATRARITLDEATNGNITFATNGTGSVVIPKADVNGGTIDNTTIGLTTPASAVFTGVTVAGNVSINGNLFVSGSATQVNTTDLIVKDPIIFLAEGNLNDTVDIGFTAAYNHSLTPPRHTGLVRDNVSKKWTLFSNLSSEVLSAVQIPFDNPSLVVDTLVANVEGTLTGSVSGTLTGNVSGTALKANQFTTGRIISATGDISYSSGSFDGSTNVTGTATINNDAVTTSKILDSNVTYSKIQNVQYDTILGRKTSFPVSGGGQGVVEEITCTSAARDLLDDADAAAQRTTLGVGTTDSVTFSDVTVNNGTRSVLRDVYSQSVTSTNLLSLPTFAKANYNSAKFTVQIKQGTTRRCVLEILATNDNGTWEGTVYGIVDPANIFVNVDTVTTGSTVDLSFTFNGNVNYTVTASVEAISD